MSSTPIVYEGVTQLRFSDLDAYGHLSATKYIDIVGSSRLTVLEQKYGISMEELIKRKIGFYLKKIEIEYFKPVFGLVSIMQRSFIAENTGPMALVDFTVLSANGQTKHAAGKLHYVVIDLTTNKPCPAPNWLISCFFE